MRILIVHSRYASGAASGENRVVEDETALLREAGHDVMSWEPTMDARASTLTTGARAIWNQTAAKHVRELARQHRPDVVHVHNMYPNLSPVVLRVGRDLETPVVLSLHNFRILCLPATLLRDGVPCEDCVGKLPWRGVVHGCYRGSRLGSASIATSLALHRRMRSFEHVTRFFAVSDFVRDKYIAAGARSDQIVVKPNFVTALARREGPGDDFVTLGRLSPEKGVSELLDMWPSARLEIVGEGPERPRLEQKAGRLVSFAGAVQPRAVPKILREARALVHPSRCYEAQPRAILEAFAAGVPVIASRIGGLPELVEDGVNGLLVDVDDRRGWRAAVERLTDDREATRLGDGAYRTWEARFTPEIGLRCLVSEYRAAMSLVAKGASA